MRQYPFRLSLLSIAIVLGVLSVNLTKYYSSDRVATVAGIMVDVAVIILVYIVIRAIVRFFRFANSEKGLEPIYNRIKNDHLSTFLFLVISGGAGLIEASRSTVINAPTNTADFVLGDGLAMVILWLGYLFCVIWWLWNFFHSVNPKLGVAGTMLDINRWPAFLQTMAVFTLIAAAISAVLFIGLTFSYYAANILSLIIPT